MTCKIGTLNLCLGLKNKIESIKRIIKDNNIDVCCLQETEIEHDFPKDLLSFKGYNYESEINTHKSRCGIYITNEKSYTRRQDLEGNNSHLVIIDINDQHKTRIINVYRSFNPPMGLTQKTFFEMQVELIKIATNPQTIIIGDFNLDFNKKYDVQYSHKHYFNILDVLINEKNLMQIVNFDTWSRNINNTIKTSLLDHVYISNPTKVSNLTSLIPPFGDHVLISFDIHSQSKIITENYKRNWKQYSKPILVEKLQSANLTIDTDDVQTYWNCFESILVDIVDQVAPLEKIGKITPSNKFIPASIKNKINKRDRLLKKTIPNSTPEKKSLLKTLNKEIKSYFHYTKSKNVRRGILPGNSKSLWDAVNIANDKNVTRLPDKLFLSGVEVPDSKIASAFGDYFVNKVNLITSSTLINPNVHNGHQKIFIPCEHGISINDVAECIKSLKIKNSEGFDRIPQRILSDGIELLLKPLTDLFALIFKKQIIPKQWLISKTIPIHKKGPKSNIENYRPIANLCSVTKIFEKLILIRLQKLEKINNIDLTGKNQHGFKKNKSTATLGIQLQSLIARALDEDEYVGMASLDLSSAFDVVDIGLLLKRLGVLGLPGDMVSLIGVWLKERKFYVEANGHTSNFFDSNYGTVQGSILGPILYAIFVAPLFDLTDLYNFADDNFSLSSNKSKTQVKKDLESKLELILKWLTDSGLKVNENKTELCLFHRKDTHPITILLNNATIVSKLSINVLGVLFDSKLTWSKQVSQTTQKAKKSLHAIKMIRKYFTKGEITTLLTSNFYSILYYNSEIWHIPTLAPELKQILLSASANALKLSQHVPNQMQSFISIHEECKRALPEQMMLYKHAIMLHKLYDENYPETEWLALNFQQTTCQRQTKFYVLKSNNYKIGNNILTNRLSTLNNKIDLNDLNKSLSSFKVLHKTKILTV